MGFSEVISLDADNAVALGKRDKKTGKAYPKQAEGHYLGSRTVQGKRGPSVLHFLSTPNGNLGVWGTTDLNRKLGAVLTGTMVRITSTGTKPTPNGDMYMYKVEQDRDNTNEVGAFEAESSVATAESDDSYEDLDGSSDEDSGYGQDVAPAVINSNAEKVKALLNRTRKV